MIISQLGGGLGNQMFQYAAGKAVAHRLNTKHYLDIDRIILNKSDHVIYNLNHFNISSSVVPKKVVPFIHPLSIKVKNRIRVHFPTLYSLYRSFFLKQSYFKSQQKEDYEGHGDRFWRIKDNTYMEGYFQSHLFFKEINEIICNEFQLKTPLSKQGLYWKEKISASSQSVSVHIRGGDYLTNSSFITLGKSYYEIARKIIDERRKKATYFIFSNDMAWAKSIFPASDAVFFIENTISAKPYEDLYLMSLCNDNIIANSTFSWWAAYLNMSPQKIVITPKEYFSTVDTDESFLYPSDWIRIATGY